MINPPKQHPFNLGLAVKGQINSLELTHKTFEEDLNPNTWSRYGRNRQAGQEAGPITDIKIFARTYYLFIC
jgi:hypothetical protein